jgi:hypothetical protein
MNAELPRLGLGKRTRLLMCWGAIFLNAGAHHIIWLKAQATANQ